jgi:type VI secretion system secreted protein Hcp
MRRTIATTALLLAFVCSSAMASFPFYITVEGERQGKFKGESLRPGHSNEQEGIAFSYEVKAPTDRASGQASGKRQHGALTITKEWGASSPQFFKALVENEVLRSVVLQFVTEDPGTGGEIVYHKITLTNARIIQINAFKDRAVQREFNETPELESISFSFEKIEIENVKGKTSAMDNWRQ